MKSSNFHFRKRFVTIILDVTDLSSSYTFMIDFVSNKDYKTQTVKNRRGRNTKKYHQKEGLLIP